MRRVFGIKFLVLLLVLSTLLSLTSCMAFWLEQIGYDQMFEYTEFEDGYEIKGTPFIVGVMMSKKKFENMVLEIPSEYNGKPIVAIADEAFLGNVYLNKVIIPDTVRVIGNGAFSDCMTLFECNIPSSVTVIGDAAFKNCSYLKVSIPEGVTTIGTEAFYHTMIYDEKGLFPDVFDFVMDTSIFIRTELNELRIPSTVTSIGEGAFGCTTSIVKFDVDENNPAYKSIDGVLYTKDGKNLLQYPLASSALRYSLSDDVENIGNYAFAEADHLENINISENSSLKRVGIFAFTSCDLLERLDFPASLESIGEQAIAYCNSLQTCVIGSSDVALGDKLWLWSSQLDEIGYAGSINQMKEYLDAQDFGHSAMKSVRISCSDGYITFYGDSYTEFIMPEYPNIEN